MYVCVLILHNWNAMVPKCIPNYLFHGSYHIVDVNSFHFIAAIYLYTLHHPLVRIICSLRAVEKSKV